MQGCGIGDCVKGLGRRDVVYKSEGKKFIVQNFQLASMPKKCVHLQGKNNPHEPMIQNSTSCTDRLLGTTAGRRQQWSPGPTTGSNTLHKTDFWVA